MSAIVYFSSVSENTKRFVESCNFDGLHVYRIPLRANDDRLLIHEPYVLITPTYGGGAPGRSVPVQVKRFLKDQSSLMRGVIASGNTNFGEAYAHAGDVISARFHVPMLYRFELLGTSEDRRIVSDGVKRFLSMPSA
jgi:protein involved in ribonucleotide reduction